MIEFNKIDNSCIHKISRIGIWKSYLTGVTVFRSFDLQFRLAEIRLANWNCLLSLPQMLLPSFV